MKKIIALIAILLASNSFATIKNADPCEHITGKWSGTGLLKNEDMCKQLNGCAHYISAEVDKVGQNAFMTHFTSSLGDNTTVPNQCKNGKITTPLDPNVSARITCSSDEYCAVYFEDTTSIISMVKHG